MNEHTTLPTPRPDLTPEEELQFAEDRVSALSQVIKYQTVLLRHTADAIVELLDTAHFVDDDRSLVDTDTIAKLTLLRIKIDRL